MCIIIAKGKIEIFYIMEGDFKMRFYTVKINGKQTAAVLHKSGKLIPVSDFADMNSLIDNITDSRLKRLKADCEDDNASGLLSFDEVKMCAPIPVPKQDLICLGVNYSEHIEETKHIESFTDKTDTVYFSKRANYAIGDGDFIPNYDFVNSLDYEAELGVIIGKDCKNISEQDASDYIFGYTVVNDISGRNIQFKHKQWFFGKSLDGYTAIGPCIVTADEIGDINSLKISCSVNGEIRQNSNTSLMITKVPEAISELSKGITLKSGTIISTGTPGGVALGANPPVWLKSGDEVICEIEKIGRLRNKVS